MLILLDPQSPATQWATLLTPLIAAVIVLIQVYTETLRRADKEKAAAQQQLDNERHKVAQTMATQTLLASSKNTQLLEAHSQTIGAIKDHLTGDKPLIILPTPSKEELMLNRIKQIVLEAEVEAPSGE